MRFFTLILALAAAITPAAAAEQRTFKDWQVLCRDDGYCTATSTVTGQPQAADASYAMHIGRPAQQTYWEMSFTATPTVPDEWGDFVFAVDEKPTTFSGRNEIGAYGSPDQLFLLGDKAQTLMDALMPGRTLSVSFADTKGDAYKAAFSLSGLTAALLWIDEKQHRIGSERVASAAPYGLTPAGSEQQTTPEVPADLLDLRNADRECRPLEEIANSRDFVVAELGEGYTLYVLPCDSAAYNFASEVYVYDGAEYRRQYFADYAASTGWTGAPILFSADYDKEAKTLTSFYKGRGIGDCGTQGSWVWTGSLFEMTEYRSKEDCDGKDDPWPVVFQRKVSGPPAKAD